MEPFWKARNVKIWDGKITSVERTLLVARDALSEWLCMRKCHQMHLHEPTVLDSSASNWEKPPCGVLKCNVDCAFFNSNTTAGFGLCIRDPNGAFLLARTATVNVFLSGR